MGNTRATHSRAFRFHLVSFPGRGVLRLWILRWYTGIPFVVWISSNEKGLQELDQAVNFRSYNCLDHDSRGTDLAFRFTSPGLHAAARVVMGLTRSWTNIVARRRQA